ncbi:hypothetical protein XENOCAPTIV_006465 [Xenoophorus captivus]|uniref:Uncharacterized protein n=1 Tax=Xenoophorus captivus TaxID=1517983 RepID=A0ABV0QQA8_9TELE
MIHGLFLTTAKDYIYHHNCLSCFSQTLRDGTPGSQTVTERFSLGWPQVLCSTHNVALAWVDGRSGVGRGQKTVVMDPRKLGLLKVKDYLGVVESVNFYSRIVLKPLKEAN